MKLRGNSKLDEYPHHVQTYGRKITVVGVSTMGCLIAHSLSLQCKQLGNFLYLSCDEDDLVNIPSSHSNKKIVFPLSGERNPSNVRGAVTIQLEQIRKTLAGSQVVIVVSGLGGTIGSGIAPLVARCAKQVRAFVVGIVTMPFEFEKRKHFFAGCALRQLTENSDGILVLGRTLGRQDNLSAIDSNARLFEKLALALNSLVPPVGRDGIGSGVENVVDYIRANPYSTLQMAGESQADYISEEAPNSSGVLVSYQSRQDVDAMISNYDPVDSCLRRASSQNLDPDLDSAFQFGQGILRNIES